MKKVEKLFIYVCFFASMTTLKAQDYAQRIYVEGTKFKVEDKEIFLNGSNTPWIAWNDFGIGRFDSTAWAKEFQKLEDNGVNSTRVWISCNGEKNPLQLSESGHVGGPTQAFLNDLDVLVEIAREHRVYLMVALISFDHTITKNPYSDRWWAMYRDTANMNSFVENYAVKISKRYNDNPYFFSLDVCNEILWVTVDENHDRGDFPWANIQYLVGKTAQRVHEETDVLVCVSNYIKYTSPSYQGNKYSDEALQAQVNDPDAYVDFYKVHYYSWVHPYFDGFHFDHTPDHYGMGEKPCITGEIRADGGYNNSGARVYTSTEYYEKHLKNGWVGCMPWTSNGVDINGDIDGPHGDATRAFRAKHYSLVYPLGGPCTISPSQSSVVFKSALAAIKNITVASDSVFTMRNNENWLYTKTSGETLTIEVTANTGSQLRKDTILLSGCETREIIVSQHGSGTPTEDAISMRAYPLIAEAGQEITVRADYSSVSDADKVRVDLFDNFTSWKWFAGSQLDISTPSSGTHDFSMTIPSDISEGTYNYFANIKNESTDVITASEEISIVGSLAEPELDTIAITSSPENGVQDHDIKIEVEYQVKNFANQLRVDVFDKANNLNWVTGVFVGIAAPITGAHGLLLRIPSTIDNGDYIIVASVNNAGISLASDTTDIAISLPSASGVSISKCPESKMKIGQTVYLSAKVEPENANDESVSWSSSADSIVSVNAWGMIRAKAPGTATITATTNTGGHVAGCTVTVDDFNSIVQNETTSDFTVFPNPANGQEIHIKTNNYDAIIEIYYLLGHKVFSKCLQGEKNAVVDISNFTSGVYIIRVNERSKRILLF